MKIIKFNNKQYRLIPFLITVGILLFFVFWIGGLAYKYHLETEERRKLQAVDVAAKARDLNSQIYEENKKLKEENEHLKSVPYEFIRENGEKEYYNLFTHKLFKKIDKDDTIWEYEPNNGMLLKSTDKCHTVTLYGSHGKMIKKTLSDGVWMEYNPVNAKLMKRKNIDNSIEEFDDNEEKFKEIDKNSKVKFFKTNLYQNILDFKKLFINDKGLEKVFLESRIFNLEELKAAGYTLKDLISAGYSFQDLKYPPKLDYYSDGTMLKITEYNQDTGKLNLETFYNNPDGTIYQITEFNQDTGERHKNTEYYKTGEKSFVFDYHKDTGKLIKETNYNLDGTVKEIKTYNYV